MTNMALRIQKKKLKKKNENKREGRKLYFEDHSGNFKVIFYKISFEIKFNKLCLLVSKYLS